MALGLFGRKKGEQPAADEASRQVPADSWRPPAEDAAAQLARRAAEAQVEALRRRAEMDSMAPVKDSALFALYRQLYGTAPKSDARGQYSLAVMMEEEGLPSREQRQWLMGLDRRALGMPQYGLKKKPVLRIPQADGVPLPPAERPQPADAVPFVQVSADGMAAWLFLMPPVRGGEEVPVSHVLEKLAEQGVRYGLDEEKVRSACRQGWYLRLLKVAEGTPARDGEDGDVLDHYKRSFEIELTEKEDRTIDFKDLGWLQTVLAGEVICDILPPVPPVDGMNVRGQVVKGRPGKKPRIPAGQGTRFIEVDNTLVAALDGVVSYSGDRFRVDPLLIVRGDVDAGVGNLDVVGSVLVHGDVREGYEVRATGDITVKGMVEAATLIAGGNIHVASGMNGAGTGRMEAGGEVKCVFIENATVSAEGTVYSETVVHSAVYSNTAVEALGGRGAIVGGAVTARNRVEALEIGNPNNRLMAVTLGHTIDFVLAQRELLERRNALAADIIEKERSIDVLRDREEATPGERAQLAELRMSIPMLKNQLAKLNGQLSVLVRSQPVNRRCKLEAGTIYPPLMLVIGEKDALLERPLRRATLHLKDGHIVATTPESQAGPRLVAGLGGYEEEEE